MKRFHQILDTTIEQNLHQFSHLAQCLEIYLEKIPKEEILQHLRFNRERLRSFFLSSMGSDSPKDMEMIDRSIKKLEKGDFNLYNELMSKAEDLKDFYMDPEQRDRLESSALNHPLKMKNKKHKKIRKDTVKHTSSRNQRAYFYQ